MVIDWRQAFDLFSSPQNSGGRDGYQIAAHQSSSYSVRRYSHGVAVEKLLELPLSGRIREVPNIQPTTLIGAGSSGLGLSRAVGVVEGGVCQGVGEIVCGSRHI